MRDDRWLYALALSSMASGVVGLLVPLYLVRIGASAAALGVGAALSSVVSAPGAVVAGRYADRTGRRRSVVVVALAAVALSVLVLPLLRSVALVIAVNALVGFALAAVGPVVTLLVVGESPADDWNDRIARLNAFQGYGATAGLVLGTVWTATVARVTAPGLATRSLFVLAGGLGVAGAALAWRSLPADRETAIGPRRAGRVTTLLAGTNRRVRDATFAFGGTRVYWALTSLRRRGLGEVRAALSGSLGAYFLAAAVAFAGFAAFWAPLPIYLARADLASGPIFGLYLVNNVASTVLYGRAGRVSARFDLRLLQGGALGVRGLAFAGVGGLALLAAGSLPGGVAGIAAVAGLLVVVGATWAFIAVVGTAIVSRSAPARARGGLLGVYAALTALSGAVGGLLGGALATVSFPLAFATGGGLAVLGAGIVVATKLLAADPVSGGPVPDPAPLGAASSGDPGPDPAAAPDAPGGPPSDPGSPGEAGGNHDD